MLYRACAAHLAQDASLLSAESADEDAVISSLRGSMRALREAGAAAIRCASTLAAMRKRGGLGKPGRIVDLGAVELYANTSSTGTAGILICPDVRLGHMFPADVLTSAKRPMS